MSNSSKTNVVTTILILSLAVISAIVATGLIAGFAMQPWIIVYWLTLTVKNSIDYGKRLGEKSSRPGDA